MDLSRPPDLPLGWSCAARIFALASPRRPWRPEILPRVGPSGALGFASLDRPDPLAPAAVLAAADLVAPHADRDDLLMALDLDTEWLRQTRERLDRDRKKLMR